VGGSSSIAFTGPGFSDNRGAILGLKTRGSTAARQLTSADSGARIGVSMLNALMDRLGSGAASAPGAVCRFVLAVVFHPSCLM
jgi:hypothetical protein